MIKKQQKKTTTLPIENTSLALLETSSKTPRRMLLKLSSTKQWSGVWEESKCDTNAFLSFLFFQSLRTRVVSQETSQTRRAGTLGWTTNLQRWTRGNREMICRLKKSFPLVTELTNDRLRGPCVYRLAGSHWVNQLLRAWFIQVLSAKKPLEEVGTN